MFRKLAIQLLVFVIGCSAPTNKHSTLEYSVDNRDFNRARFYGSVEYPDHTKLFGNVDLNSGIGEGQELEKFANRLRVVRPVHGGFGVTIESKDSTGGDNGVTGFGFSYSVDGLELRTYPLRTDRTQEAGISFKKCFQKYLNPYVCGFADVKSEGIKGEVQVGINPSDMLKVFLELRYSDFDRKSGIGDIGFACGTGLTF